MTENEKRAWAGMIVGSVGSGVALIGVFLIYPSAALILGGALALLCGFALISIASQEPKD